MALTKSRNPRKRIAAVKTHRLLKYLETLDAYIQGKERSDWVHYRGKKLVEVSKR